MKKQLENYKQEILNDPDNKKFKELGYTPIYMISEQARVLIIGQAPGIKTQEKAGVFHDQSGVRLRTWLNVDETYFYESGVIAVLPMDYFYPGKGKSGDLPPRKDFASKWHPKALAMMPNIELTILIGKYAQEYYLENGSSRITDNVLNYKQFLPQYFPLIHPSPRNQIWISKHPIFEEEIIKDLQKIVHQII